jgi:Family of unknown function (DUF6088)
MRSRYAMQGISQQLVKRLRSRRSGWVFTPKHFSGLADPRVIGVILGRLTRKGVIRRLARGLYDYPKRHPDLGILSPSPDAIARALADRDAARIQPSGAYAANLLGLTDQVPMRIVFLTDSMSRKVIVGKRDIVFKKTTPRNMATAGKVSGLVIQALRHLGQANVDDATVSVLQQRLSQDDKAQLLRDRRYAPAWVADVMVRIVEGDD